jgi:hypothetical protein
MAVVAERMRRTHRRHFRNGSSETSPGVRPSEPLQRPKREVPTFGTLAGEVDKFDHERFALGGWQAINKATQVFQGDLRIFAVSRVGKEGLPPVLKDDFGIHHLCPHNALPFSGLGAAKPALPFYADASAATRSAATACWAAHVLNAP